MKNYVNAVADSGAVAASLESNELSLTGNTRTQSRDLLTRLQTRGPEALTDAELVAVTLAVPVATSIFQEPRRRSQTKSHCLPARGNFWSR